jgi:DNA-binding MarR family transcriptional regulator
METGETNDDQFAVADALERVIGWLRDWRTPSGLSASTLSALSRLDALGSLRVTDLAELEQLTQPGMTTLINRLEDAGFAVREPDPTDGRAVRVTITPSGAARVLAYRESRAALIRTRIAQLSANDQAALIAALPAFRSFVTQPAPAKPNNENN